MRTVPDTEFLTTVGKIKFWDSLSEKWTGVFRNAPLRYSVTANTLWRIGDQLLYNQAVAHRALLPQMSAVDGYAAAGPPAFLTLWDRTKGNLAVKGVAAMSSDVICVSMP